MVAREGRIEGVRHTLQDGDGARDRRGPVVHDGPQLVDPQDAVAALPLRLLVRLVELASPVQELHLPHERAGAPGQRVGDGDVALAQQPPDQEAALLGVAAPTQDEFMRRVAGMRGRGPAQLEEQVGRAPGGEGRLLQVHGDRAALPETDVPRVPLLVVPLCTRQVLALDLEPETLHLADCLVVSVPHVARRRPTAGLKRLQNRAGAQSLYNPLLPGAARIAQPQPRNGPLRRALIDLVVRRPDAMADPVLHGEDLAHAVDTNPVRIEGWPCVRPDAGGVHDKPPTIWCRRIPIRRIRWNHAVPMRPFVGQAEDSHAL
mmetsp:Transcript_107130/g.341263  ORF Transcript_107130/g.341263 Transcript_107130/m.341263 type:complete len:318 (+) Transcript_107130:495-1448(+)